MKPGSVQNFEQKNLSRGIQDSSLYIDGEKETQYKDVDSLKLFSGNSNLKKLDLNNLNKVMLSGIQELNLEFLRLSHCASPSLSFSSFKNAKLLRLTELRVVFCGITDLDGIQFLKNLQVLYLHDNAIIDLSPLQQLSKLTFLHLSDNKISNIVPLQFLQSLQTLYLYSNNINTVDFTPLQFLPLRLLSTHSNPVQLSPEYKNSIFKVCPISVTEFFPFSPENAFPGCKNEMNQFKNGLQKPEIVKTETNKISSRLDAPPKTLKKELSQRDLTLEQRIIKLEKEIIIINQKNNELKSEMNQLKEEMKNKETERINEQKIVQEKMEKQQNQIEKLMFLIQSGFQK
ncbi:leucine-rich_repeat domain-containing protein [Hexamita inflata]|uniref:Partial n=1 Tax=Hexamita inflata TaxID=28002 RepID=A0AA86PQD4_9EUKA|nr:leucine-rich repeat domain-containing protein [Hexamita inflata]